MKFIMLINILIKIYIILYIMLNNTCIFDLETTALKTSEACILEISCVDLLTGNNIFHKYIYPSDKQKITNSNIHGIDEKKLKDNNAVDTSSALSEMVSILSSYYSLAKDDLYLIAHNNFGYDQLVLESEFQRSGIAMPHTWSFIDSLPYIKECFPVFGKTSGSRLSYKLENVYRNVTKDRSKIDFHSATVDTRVLRETIFKLLEYHRNNDEIQKTLYRYCRPQSSSGEIYEAPVNLLHGYTIKLELEKKGIVTIGQLVNICLKFQCNANVINTYLKDVLKIYPSWVRSTFAQQIVHIGNLQKTSIVSS